MDLWESGESDYVQGSDVGGVWGGCGWAAQSNSADHLLQ